LHKAFSLFQHHLKFLKTPLLMKTNKDQRQKYTLMQDIVRSEQKSRQKTKAKRGSRKIEHSLK
jgi:hypothetical protein